MAYIKGINIVIGADTTQLDTALNKIDRNTRGLNTELGAINKSLKFDPKNTDLLAQKTQILNERYKETDTRLQALKQAQNEVSEAYQKGNIPEEDYRKFQSEIAITESQLKGYEKQLLKVTEQYNHQSSVLGVTSDKLKEYGKSATDLGKKLQPFSLAAAGALGLASKSAIDFESAWAGVTKTVDGTPEQMQAIRDGIRNMSIELPSSSVEISKVAESAGQLGIKTEAILDFTKVIVDLGNATNLSGEQGASTLAKFANITKMSQQDFSRLGATIVALGNNFATTEADIADMAMNLGSAGSQVGLTQAEILALAASLSSVGLESQAGGTAFSKLMINMQLATETGSDSLEDFARVAGVSAADFTKAFKEDATGAILMFIDGLSKSGEQGESAIKILDDMEIKETRLRDTILRATNASDLFTEAIDLGSVAWEENTALTEEANKRYETTESKLAMMKNKLTDVAVELGEKLLPHISNFAEWLGDLADKFGDLSPEMQEFLLKALALTAVSAPVLRATGSISSGLGSLIGMADKGARAIGLLEPAATVATTAMASTGTAVGTATTAAAAGSSGFAGLVSSLGGAAVAAAPVALGVAAVAAAGYGLYTVITENANPAIDLFADKITKTRGELDEYGGTYQKTVETISEETKSAVGSYIDFTDGVRTEISNLYMGLTEVTTEGMDGMILKNNEMNDSVITKAKERKVEEIATLNELFAETEGITDERGQEILNLVTKNHDNQINKTEALKNVLNKIYEDIKAGGVGATKEQKDEIDRILRKMNENAVDIMSQNETEQKIILDRLNSYTTRESKETVASIIKDLNTQYEEGVAIAEAEYAEQIRIAEALRKDKSAEAQNAAIAIEKAAFDMKNGTLIELEELRFQGFDKLSESYEGLEEDFNLTNGKIRNGWEKFTATNKSDFEKMRQEFAKTSEAWRNTQFEEKKLKITKPNTWVAPTGNIHLAYNDGISYVPYHGLTATLHRGERVLTADENRQLNQQGFLDSMRSKLGDLTSNIINNVDNSNETLNFVLNGPYHIREEADIQKVARELAHQTRLLARSVG